MHFTLLMFLMYGDDGLAFTNFDRQLLDSFFNLDGYVMDFSSEKFDKFTNESIGIPIITKYGMSKAKSLKQFFVESDDNLAKKLLSDLLEYYCIFFSVEEKNADNVKRMRKYYAKVSFILKRHGNSVTDAVVDMSKIRIESKFNTEFVRYRLQELEKQMKNDSAGSIGTSKDLLESVMKMMLDSEHVSYTTVAGKTDNIPALWKKVQRTFKLDPKEMQNTKVGNNARKILSSISQIILGMDELRNSFGTGHGRNSEFNQLPIRYGNLTASLTISLIVFLTETMKARQMKGYEINEK